MAPKKKKAEPPKRAANIAAEIENAGVVIEQPITETLETNFMPYAMSVIISRAIPEIDGFKPAHRKLLYTMYKMGLLTGARTKSANIVGQTMRLNPHGDAAIYETMVRLTQGIRHCCTPMWILRGISARPIPGTWLMELPAIPRQSWIPSATSCLPILIKIRLISRIITMGA